MNYIILSIISFAFIVFVEVLKRKYKIPTYLTRRFVHIATAVVAGFAPIFASKIEIICISLLFAIGLLWGRRKNILKSVYLVDRKSYGEVFLPLGVALSAFIFLPSDIHAFQFGIFIMGLSDAVAGIVGERFGKRFFYLNTHKKSLEGSTAFFIVSCTIASTFYEPSFESLVILPVILSLSETFLVYGLDNLLLPIVSSYLATIIF